MEKAKKQKRVKKIYEEIIKSKIEKYKILQNNLCLNCYKEEGNKEEIDEYGIDTGACDKCKKTNELINEFLYFSYKEMGYSFKNDICGNVPRIYFN